MTAYPFYRFIGANASMIFLAWAATSTGLPQQYPTVFGLLWLYLYAVAVAFAAAGTESAKGMAKYFGLFFVAAAAVCALSELAYQLG